MILLDTNVISELRKPRPHGGVLAWLRENPISTLCLSSISLYELQAGTERTRWQDPAKAAELTSWITELQETITVLPFGGKEARLTAFLMLHKLPDLFKDAMIAATAITNQVQLATRNERDFTHFNLSLINPFLFGKGQS
jgi:toxin FitB